MCPDNESEWKTRKSRVDPKLESAGWKVVKFDANKPLEYYHKCAIEEYPTENGPADYALCFDSRILGIIEAKRLSLGPQNVLTQSERYSKGCIRNQFDFNGYRVPFLYSTNGEIIWHHDVRHPLNRSRTIAGFHSPDALTDFLAFDFDQTCKRLLGLPNDLEFLRPYQVEANSETEKAIAQRKRSMLLAMATGTGKTFTLVNQVYRLMKSGLARRILFLVDRRALAAQAVRAFASFEPEPGLKFDRIYEVYSQRFHKEDYDEDDKFDPKVLPQSYLTNPGQSHAFVYVSTIQRMTINLFGRNTIFALGDETIDDDAQQIDIPIHAFDLIIADECHRGYTSQELSVWRNTLDHFDSIKIGLTATPAIHTTTYFKNIVFRYEFERAIREGFLVDYDVVRIKSDVRMNGIFLEQGEQVGRVDPTSGIEQLDMLEDERKFDQGEVEDKVTSPDSNEKILNEIKKFTDDHEREYGRFPKTLIFAANDIPHTSHSDQLVHKARDIFGRGDSFVQKITGHADRPLQKIREFRNRPEPGIVITVDMLSTGVDIPDLEFIVFLRQVKSRILFEQMLGRGTRKSDRYPDKSHFTVFDCFDGTLIEYFRKATAITSEPPEIEKRTIIEVIEDIWNNRDRDFNIRCLVKRLQRIDKQISSEAREMFSSYIDKGDMAKYARELPSNLKRDFTGTMSLLRNPAFQNLLMNYPRAPRTFVIAYETVDTVESDWLIKGADGKDYKPDEYLQAFETYIRENREQVDAIGILLNKPRQWKTAVLNELLEKLKVARPRFTVENLQKVHKLHYKKALVDIISMVKHAAKEDEQLYSAQERVNRAFLKIMAGRSFTTEQIQWIERIKMHLIQNLSIDKEDFEDMPVFSRIGGWARANRVFDNKLNEFIQKCNEEIAA